MIKDIFTLLIFFMCNYNLLAQNCGTSPIDSAYFVNQLWYGNNDTLNTILESIGFFKANNSGDKSGIVTNSYTKYVPVTAWVWDNSNNSNNLEDDEVEQYINYLNQIYADNNAGIQFFICDLNRNTFPYHYDIGGNTELLTMWSLFKKDKTLNIHFCENLSGIDAPGIANTPNLALSFVLAIETFADFDVVDGDGEGRKKANTLVHEVGHTLGLEHTHRCRNCAFDDYNRHANNCTQESVSRSRTQNASCVGTGALKCEKNGDALCDTEADPGLDGNAQDEDGNYIRGGTDNWGDSWNPPIHNIMSYSDPKNIRTEFSPGQVAIMYNTVTENDKLDYTSEEKIVFGEVLANQYDYVRGYKVKTGVSYDVYDNATAELIAKEKISFKSGFHAHNGSDLHAYIDDNVACSVLGLRTANPYGGTQTSSIENIGGETYEPTNELLSVEISNFKKELKIYPNPSKGIFTVQSSNPLSKIEVYDMYGRFISRQSYNDNISTEIDLSIQEKGVYFMYVTNSKETIVKKIVKN